MITVTIAPGHWLEAAAAASYQRMRAAGMPAGGITDAGRTRTEQEVMYARYLRGELTATAARPGTSKHETGRALDLAGAARAWVRAHGRAYGWLIDQVRREPWHMEYVLVLDQHLTDPAPPPPIREEDDDMFSDQDRADVQEALRLLRLQVLATSGHASPATPVETAYVQTMRAVVDDTHEARRQCGVLLGALPPAAHVGERTIRDQVTGA